VSNPISVLLVGVGNRGRWPVERCRLEYGWRIVGLVDPVDARLAEASALAAVPPTGCFRNVAPALDVTRPRAMIVCTPTVPHVPLARLAIDRGVGVLIGKRMAPCWNDAVALGRYTTANQGVVAVGQNFRYDGVSAVVRVEYAKFSTRGDGEFRHRTSHGDRDFEARLGERRAGGFSLLLHGGPRARNLCAAEPGDDGDVRDDDTLPSATNR
jgi:predicted dehydrogenase